MKYECVICNYDTDDILSESETDKKTSIFSGENNGFFCRNCGKNFKHKSGYYRHKNHRCKEKEYSTINNDLVDKLQKKIDSLKREKDFHREKEDIYKTENEFHKNLTTNAGNIIGKSLSTLAYVMNNFKHPPQIKAIDNDEFKRLVFEDSGIKVERRNKISDFDVSKTLCSYHRHNKLVRLLINIIIKHYKKIDPEDQAIWTSDTSRLTYVISDKSETSIGNEPTWITDKGGVKG